MDEQKLKSESQEKLKSSNWLKSPANNNKVEPESLNKLIIEYYAYLEEILANSEDRIRYTGRIK